MDMRVKNNVVTTENGARVARERKVKRRKVTLLSSLIAFIVTYKSSVKFVSVVLLDAVILYTAMCKFSLDAQVNGCSVMNMGMLFLAIIFSAVLGLFAFKHD